VVDDIASTGPHYVVDDVASTDMPCGEWRGEHWDPMWWMTWRAPVMYAVPHLGYLNPRPPRSRRPGEELRTLKQVTGIVFK
jgi:hypothetical protein